MRSKNHERRKYKRYSGVPLKLYLKKEDRYHQVELIDISIGGFLSNTGIHFEVYDKYEAKIQFPNDDLKDVVHGHAIVWRIEADKEHIEAKKRYVAFQFINISDADKNIIQEYLNNFKMNVPYK